MLKLIKKKQTKTTEVSGQSTANTLFKCSFQNVLSSGAVTNTSCTCKTSLHGFPDPRNFCEWNPESGKFSLVESEILGFHIRSTDKGIRNPRIRIPGTGFQNPRRGIQNSWLSWITLTGALFFFGCPYSCPPPPFVFSLFPLPPVLL